jgi:hypothetical protein
VPGVWSTRTSCQTDDLSPYIEEIKGQQTYCSNSEDTHRVPKAL